MTICDHCKQSGDVRVISIRVAPEAGMAHASARLTASLAHTDKSGLDYSLELCAACRQQLLAPLEALTAWGRYAALRPCTVAEVEAQEAMRLWKNE